MLRVTVTSMPDLTTLKLEGKLASASVQEASRCADDVVSTIRGQNVAVDLTNVTYVDDAGRRLLAELTNKGVRLISDDPVMDAIVDGITVRNPGPANRQTPEPFFTNS